MAQSISATMSALFVACRDVIFVNTKGADGQQVLVVNGDPGQFQPHSIIAVGMAVRMPIERPTMGTNRSREQKAEIDSTISVYVPGDESSQAIANAAALDMQGQLEAYFRATPNQSLAGACRDAFVSRAELTPAVAMQSFDDPSMAPIATGRIAEITVTVSAAIRY